MLVAYAQLYLPLLAMLFFAISAMKIYQAGFHASGLAIGVPSSMMAFSALMSEIWSGWEDRFVYGPNGEVLWRAGEQNVWHHILDYIFPVGLFVVAIGLWVLSRRIATLNKEGLGTAIPPPKP